MGSKNYVYILLAFAAVEASAGICGTGTLSTTYNPFTGKLDFVCVYPASGGGGASTLEVFSNYSNVRSSPTASVGVGNGLAATVTSSTFSFGVDYSSVPSRSDAILNSPNAKESKTVFVDSGTFFNQLGLENQFIHPVGGWNSSRSITFTHRLNGAGSNSDYFYFGETNNGEPSISVNQSLPTYNLEIVGTSASFGGNMLKLTSPNASVHESWATSDGNLLDQRTTSPDAGSEVDVQFNVFPAGSNLSSFHIIREGTKGTGIRLFDHPAAHYVGFKSSTTVPANVDWVLPQADGTANQAMVTDGNKNLSFATVSGSGGAPWPVAVGTGSTGNFSVYSSSPTSGINFNSALFTATLQNATTSFVGVVYDSMTTMGQLFAGSNISLSVGTHGTTISNNPPQVLIAGATNYLPNQSTATVLFPFGTVVSSIVINGGLTMANNIRTVSYTLLSTDTVILASCTASGGCTMTLPTAANGGENHIIIKVDSSTQTVTVKGASTDVIITTNTISLQAQQANIHLTSDGSKWFSTARVPNIPPFLGYNADPNSASAVVTSSDVTYVSIYVPEPCTAYAIRLAWGTAFGTADIGIYDSDPISGNPNNKLASSGATTIVSGLQTINFSSQLNLIPGSYWLAVDINNATATLTRFGIDQIVGVLRQTSTSNTLPANAASLSATNARSYSLVALLRHATTGP